MVNGANQLTSKQAYGFQCLRVFNGMIKLTSPSSFPQFKNGLTEGRLRQADKKADYFVEFYFSFGG